jgi:hypothetical protein
VHLMITGEVSASLRGSYRWGVLDAAGTETFYETDSEAVRKRLAQGRDTPRATDPYGDTASWTANLMPGAVA